MPTIRITDRTIAGLKPSTGRQVDYFDRTLPGFGVRVSPRGRKTFVVMYRTVERRFRRLTLGVYPALKLTKARELARGELRKAVDGRDPASERSVAVERTFDALARLYLEQHAKRKKRSWRADARMIRRELAAWSTRPVTAIRRADVRDVLEAIVARRAPVLANRVLALVRKMLNFALDREWVEANVAAKMARPAAEQSRSRVLTEREVQAVWEHLDLAGDDSSSSGRQTRLARAALKLRLITAQRGKEVLSMRWRDIDDAWWTIPPDVAKNKQAHRVFLASAALAVLEEIKPVAGPDYVFAGARGTRQRRGVLSGVAVDDLRPHDFRRTAASMMAASGIPRLTISKVLNHVETGVTAIYDRHGYDPEKQAALTWWSSRLMGIVSANRDNVRMFSKRV